MGPVNQVRALSYSRTQRRFDVPRCERHCRSGGPRFGDRDAGEVRYGSKVNSPAASKSSPLFPNKPTFDRNHLVSQKGQYRPRCAAANILLFVRTNGGLPSDCGYRWGQRNRPLI